MKCDNCSRDAVYVYGPKPLSPVHYCSSHLPTFLRDQARAGLLETTPAFDDARQSALEKLAPASAAPEPAPEPAPVSKASRKKRSPKPKPVEADPAEETAEA